MDNSKQDYILTAYGFLGGATFTALFFLLQDKDPIVYHNAIVGGLATTSILFLILFVARLNISNGNIKPNTLFSKTVSWLGVAGFGSLLIILIMLVMNVNSTIGLIVLSCTVGFIVLLQITARRSR